MLKAWQVSQWSNVWAFAVVLYEVATNGAVPFEDKSLVQVRQAVCKGDHVQLPQFWPAAVQQSVKACWAMNPEDRPNFAALEAALHGAWEQERLARQSAPAVMPRFAKRNLAPEMLDQAHFDDALPLGSSITEDEDVRRSPTPELVPAVSASNTARTSLADDEAPAPDAGLTSSEAVLPTVAHSPLAVDSTAEWLRQKPTLSPVAELSPSVTNGGSQLATDEAAAPPSPNHAGLPPHSSASSSYV